MLIPLDRLRILALLTTTVSSIGLAASQSVAQAKNTTGQTWLSGTATDAVAPRPLSLEFPGGTLAEFLQAVRVAGDGANIVASDLANGIALPSISLKNASVATALMAVAQIVPVPFRANVREEREVDRSSVFAFQLIRNVGPTVASVGPAAPANSESAVHALGQWVDASMMSVGMPRLVLSPDAILSAIDVGLSLTNGEDPTTHATLRYHAETHLLFVRGTSRQIHLVSQTIVRLTDDLKMQRGLAARANAKRPNATDPTPGDKQRRGR